MKILLVEDDPMVVLFAEEALEEAGHIVLGPATSYNEAIKLAEIDIPDLGLLDINIVGQETGIDVSRDLHARHVPCVFVSGNYLDDNAKKYAVGSLAKPYTLDALIEVVEFVRCQIAGNELPALPRGLVLFPIL